jgi:hypothetical protein
MIGWLMVVVDKDERSDSNGAIESKGDDAAKVVFIRLIYKTVAVTVGEVIGQDRDVADFRCTKISIEVAIGAVCIEHYQVVRETVAGVDGYVHALSGILIAADNGAGWKATEVDGEGLARAILSRGRLIAQVDVGSAGEDCQGEGQRAQ